MDFFLFTKKFIHLGISPFLSATYFWMALYVLLNKENKSERRGGTELYIPFPLLISSTKKKKVDAE